MTNYLTTLIFYRHFTVFLSKIYIAFHYDLKIRYKDQDMVFILHILIKANRSDICSGKSLW